MRLLAYGLVCEAMGVPILQLRYASLKSPGLQVRGLTAVQFSSLSGSVGCMIETASRVTRYNNLRGIASFHLCWLWPCLLIIGSVVIQLPSLIVLGTYSAEPLRVENCTAMKPRTCKPGLFKPAYLDMHLTLAPYVQA